MREIQVKTKKVTVYFLIGLVVLLVLVSFLVGFYIGNGYTQFNKYGLFGEAYGVLQKSFIGQLPDENTLEHGMIKGVLSELNDPYTVLVEPPEHQLQSDQLAGKYGGIGARIEQDSNSQYRIYPFPDSPSEQAGLQNGDILLEIDSLQISPVTAADVVQAALRGPDGSQVKVVIRREATGQNLTFTLDRKEIPLPSVTWNLLPENGAVGVVQINIIAATTPDEIQNAIGDLQKQGARYFVLDLRNNGGGLVDAGIKIAELFLPAKAPVMDQQYKDQPTTDYNASQDGIFSDLPLYVLINHNTASAAEIIAGALQVNSRAVLIGQPSYGKDTIQLVYDLSDGSSLHVTSAKWWIPSLNPPIAGNGLQPDISIPEDPTDTLNTRYFAAVIDDISK